MSSGSDNQKSEYSYENDSDDQSALNSKRKGKKFQEKRQKKKLKSNKEKKKNVFIEDEVEETDEEEESVHSQDEINKNQYKDYEQALQKRQRNVPAFLRMKTDKEIEDYYNEKYVISEIDSEGEDFYAQTQLPTINDPKLWKIPCRRNKERELALSILNKFFIEKDKLPINIFSASAIDHQKGSIFIEAMTKQQVIQALTGFDDIMLNRIEMIPPDKVRSIFQPLEKEEYNVKIGQFVRVKAGLYKNDLAQVINYQDERNQVLVKLKPRPDLKGFEEKQKQYDKKKHLGNNSDDDFEFNGGDEQQKNKKKNPFQQGYNRPIKRFLDSDDELQNNYLLNHKQEFDENGYHIKKFHVSKLILDEPRYSVDELMDFFKDNVDIDKILDEQASNLRLSHSNKNKFLKGDKVRVLNGALKNLVGIISSIEGNNVKIKKKQKKQEIEYAEDVNNLIKEFKIGQHVKVTGGHYINKTGIILSILTGGIAVLLTDNDNQIKVLVNDLSLSNEQSVDVVDVGTSLKKFDLIKLVGYNQIGIILSVSNDSLQILNTNNEIQTISRMSFDSKINTKTFFCKNQRGDTIDSGSNVLIQQGSNKGKKAEVRHVYNDYLFLFNPEFNSTQGILVEKANNCIVISRKIKSNIMPKKDEKIDGQIGQIVQVSKGIYKGQQGKIEQIKGEFVTMTIRTNNKRVKLKVDEVFESTSWKDQNINTPFYDQGQSVYNPNTPHYKNSPAYEPTTPHKY